MPSPRDARSPRIDHGQWRTPGVGRLSRSDGHRRFGEPLGESGRGRPFRLWVPVAVSAVVQVPYAIAHAVRGSGETRPVALAALALAVLAPVVLTAARRYPGPVVAIVAAAASAGLLLDQGGPPYVALAFAIVGALARGARVWAWIAIAAAWAVTLVGGALLGIDWRPFQVAGTTFGVLVLLGVGEFARTRRERFAQMSVRMASIRETELQAERVRIARELHDVLAHSLSQINVQAGVGLHLSDSDPAKAAEALSNIKESSRTALDEVRAVLGVLRSDQDAPPLRPEPDLDGIAALATSVSAAGVGVDLVQDVTATPPTAVQSAVYRIVQESLTNVVRHSGATSAAVRITDQGGDIVVEVRDDGHGASGGPSEGRGLIGMRERATLLGGELTTHSDPTGFTVRATLPGAST